MSSLMTSSLQFLGLLVTLHPGLQIIKNDSGKFRRCGKAKLKEDLIAVV